MSNNGQIMQKRWSFPDAPNTAVITTARVAHKNKAILGVIHQAGWQFLDGEDVAASDAVVVALRELIQKDASLELLADLPEGWQAWRKTPGSPWQCSPL